MGSATEGAEAVNKTPEEFRNLIASEIAKWGKAVKEAGIKAEFGCSNLIHKVR